MKLNCAHILYILRPSNLIWLELFNVHTDELQKGFDTPSEKFFLTVTFYHKINMKKSKKCIHRSQFDKSYIFFYDAIMKRVFILICLVVLCALVLGGCGVRSELEHDADYPRNYPVY